MNLPQNCTLSLLAAPDETAQAAQYGLPLGHMAYRVGAGPHLYRTHPRIPLHGGIMVVDQCGFDGKGAPESLCREIIQECAARRYTGVFCDFEGQLPTVLRRAVDTLSSLLAKHGWALYLPEGSLSPLPAGVKVVVSSALSGGSLAQRLEEAVRSYGAHRVALGLERVAEDFTLPAVTGSGKPLTQEQLRRLLIGHRPAVYFSDELCAHYFTYMRPGESAHFILYDDAASLTKKLHVAAGLGVQQAFLPFSQSEDLLRELTT